ncbi:hypothetical protein FA13DRAFT_1584662, partial [Coprinellus micaceus]
NPLGPFPNLSSFELGEWFVNRGAQFSVQSLQCLVKLAQRPSFAQDISNANWPRIFRALSEGTEIGHSPSEPDEWVDDDGWESTPISISVPLSKSTTSHVTGTLYYRSIVSILREKVLNSSDMRLFHYEPSEVLWQPDYSTRATRIHSELYNSEAFLRTHQELQDSPAPPGCKLQRVVAALMFWSDATHVSSFSDQKLWPGYMAFGNESKYRRCRPSEHLCHNIAYFSDLPDGLKDLITSKTTGGNVPDKLMHFCKQEMLHAQWKILLDDEEFREAVKNGIVLKCPDNEERRFYIRIFTYSADYQEKVLIATIRGTNGLCPCPRCLVSKTDLSQMGTAQDLVLREEAPRKDDGARLALVRTARDKMLVDCLGLSNPAVDGPLKAQSLQPVSNAFSIPNIFASGVDIFGALVVDQMHEFEQGVWKDLFIHLLRVLVASGPGESLAHVLDRRFRLVPSFGRTIRRFSDNVSEQKRKTARDYEDLLQCAIPVFDGILANESHSAATLSLLAVCAEWHALAKLRMHTDDTLQLLQDTTVKLGSEFRSFLDGVCQEVATEELDSEKEAREAQQKKTKAAQKTRNAKAAESSSPALQQGKTLSLTKPKFHFLGDYVKTIQLFGTTDNYSTETGELMHRSSKRWYRRSSKRNPRKEVVRHERKGAAGRRPDIHHYIGINENKPISLLSFANRPDASDLQDPLLKTFIHGLQAHLLTRLTQGHNIPNLDPTRVYFKNHRIFSHKIMRLKYTTYDVRRGEDVIHLNADTCNIMVQNPKYISDQKVPPYLYGHVLGIFHADANYSGELGQVPALPIRVEFLWVRWYESVNNAEPKGPLECITFPDITSPDSTTFIDPMSALRAAHVIPRFSRGRKYSDGNGLSKLAKDGNEWSQYYVNRFVDRDMYMRYKIGMAVGH